MAKGSNNCGTIFASFLISVLLVGGGAYFGLPVLYPSLSQETDTMPEQVVQSKIKEINSTAYIFDYDTSPEIMEDTQMNITTRGNTKLAVSFDVVMEISVANGFEGSAYYNVTLRVEGVKQETVRITEYHGEPIVGQHTKDSYIQISFETPTLPAGTYDIMVIWYSFVDTTVVSQLSASSVTYDPPIRTLEVQEITT